MAKRHQALLDFGLIVPDVEGKFYRTTDRGRAYVEGLKAVPLPVAKWVIPDISK